MKEAKFTGILCATVLALGSAVWVVQAQDLPPEVAHYADIVFYNGRVLTMDRDQPPITVTQAGCPSRVSWSGPLGKAVSSLPMTASFLPLLLLGGLAAPQRDPAEQPQEARISLGTAVVTAGQEFSLPLYLAPGAEGVETRRISFDLILPPSGLSFVKLEPTYPAERVQAELSVEGSHPELQVRIRVPEDSDRPLPAGPVAFLGFRVSEDAGGGNHKLILQDIELEDMTGQSRQDSARVEGELTVVSEEMVPLFSCFFYLH